MLSHVAKRSIAQVSRVASPADCLAYIGPARVADASVLVAKRRGLATLAAASEERYVQISEERFDELISHEMAYFATVPDQAMSVRQILDASPEDLARICWTEGPKRLALRIRFLESLGGWQDIAELAKMHQMLSRWYRSLALCEKKLSRLTQCVSSIRNDGHQVIPLVSAGIHKLQRAHPGQFEEQFLNRWLDNFFLSRISTNVLADQLVARVSVRDGGKGTPTGIIDPRCNASRVCQHAANLAAKICMREKGIVPPFSIETYDSSSMEPTDAPCVFSYIPSYLTYMILELMKNSFKATVDRSSDKEEVKRRPICIRVCHDEQRVAILVSDRAGGIPFDVGDNIWSYLYGACAKSSDGHAAAGASPLGGYGVGLPLSRLYARYLGGKLHVTSYPGYGTQAHLLLPRIAVEQVERLPSSTSNI